MQPVERIFLPVRKAAVMLRVLSGYARMPIPGLARVFQEKRVYAIGGIPAGIDIETVVSQFFGAIRQRREEMSQQTALGLCRNLPNPEKSEYMVNADFISVLVLPDFSSVRTISARLKIRSHPVSEYLR